MDRDNGSLSSFSLEAVSDVVESSGGPEEVTWVFKCERSYQTKRKPLGEHNEQNSIGEK